MPFSNIFKKKKKKEPEKKIEPREVPKTPKVSKAPRKRNTAFRVLRGGHITEKATDLAGKNQYVFKVYPGANKKEIKKSVQDIYNVKVEKVRIINIPRKKRRLGKQEGWKSGYRKAVVSLKEGENIEIMPR